MHFNKISLAASLFGCGVLLAACGGDSTPSKTVASADTTAAVTASTAQAMVNKSFSFDSGVSALGTTSATTIALSGSSANPDFSLSSGGFGAKGGMTYGSCIFKITQSNFPATFTKLQVGATTEVKPCDLKLATAGLTTGSSNSFVKWILGNASSISLGVTVTISESGVVTVSGTPFGTITFVIATGATGLGG
ncbi:hypothetical protein [Polaromonas glacialis]|uniref:hypothetical protein n=1 Tax=Polaromonas glacialis TaxID=866564 RepID=UPI0012EB4A69|nr:hypothetical protein [Polaromonas glacialis]